MTKNHVRRQVAITAAALHVATEDAKSRHADRPWWEEDSFDKRKRERD